MLPVWKFATFEDARDALDGDVADEGYLRRLSALWELSAALCPLRVYRGVKKFRTMEEAEEDRRLWDLRPALG